MRCGAVRRGVHIGVLVVVAQVGLQFFCVCGGRLLCSPGLGLGLAAGRTVCLLWRMGRCSPARRTVSPGSIAPGRRGRRRWRGVSMQAAGVDYLRISYAAVKRGFEWWQTMQATRSCDA